MIVDRSRFFVNGPSFLKVNEIKTEFVGHRIFARDRVKLIQERLDGTALLNQGIFVRDTSPILHIMPAIDRIG